ncbi:MAG: hypothetical protein ACK4P3_05710 [Fimbriimonadaceae bacterium]
MQYMGWLDHAAGVSEGLPQAIRCIAKYPLDCFLLFGQLVLSQENGCQLVGNLPELFEIVSEIV